MSEKSGLGIPEVKGMGLVLADFNNDGWTDVFIANDTWPNSLFINKKDGTFDDVSFMSGVAASEDGKYEAGMGTDAADVDGDGWFDIYVTHLDFELNRLYHNNHDNSFDDATYSCGMGNKAIFLSGVSAKLFDYDNDGWIDIFQVNGSMLDNIKLYHSEETFPEPKLMFRNLGQGKFEKVSELLGPDFMKPVVGRGSAVADFDNDGDLDIADFGQRRLPSTAAQRRRQCQQLAGSDAGRNQVESRRRGRGAEAGLGRIHRSISSGRAA